MTCSDWRELYTQLADMYYAATGNLVPPPTNPKTGKKLKPVVVSEKQLKKWYLKDKMRMWEIADMLGCSESSVSNLLKRYGIQVRRPCEYPKTDEQIRACRKHMQELNAAEPGFASKKGGAATRLKRLEKGYEFGGHEVKTKSGYIVVYAPEHPRANKAGTVPKHTLVMERHLGRYLEDDEVVHHINHIRDDNRIENLQLMQISEHLKMHGHETAKKRCRPEEE